MGYIGNQITTVFPSSISVDSATISGNTTIGGTLGVTGATTLSNKLADTNMSTGSIVQIVQTYDNTNEASYTNTSFTNITHLDTTITPQVSGSKFLIECTISGAHNDDAYVAFKLFEDNNIIKAKRYFVFKNILFSKIFRLNLVELNISCKKKF